MKSFDPSALWVKAMMRTASVASRGYESTVKLKAWLQQNPLAALAVLLIVVAVALRVMGIM
jgi:hypothetical protein